MNLKYIQKINLDQKKKITNDFFQQQYDSQSRIKKVIIHIYNYNEFGYIIKMYYQILLIKNIFFIQIKNALLDMTINNPIFIFAVIIVIWFIPGILVRRFNEVKQMKKNKSIQADAIRKLYPKSKD